MSSMDNLAGELYSLIKESDDRKPKAYDTTAEVIRIEDDTVWVHIDGGVEETPVRRTINAKEGDRIRIHVANGSAWIIGNESSPPTDDSYAKYVEIRTSDSVDYVEELRDKDVTVNSITATTGYIEDLRSNNITANNIVSATGYISDLTAGQITADDIIADHAEVQDLDANYAEIDAANITSATIQDAWINKLLVQTGLIANDADVFVLDAIQVNAANITAGTLDVNRLIVTIGEGSSAQKYLVNINPETGTPSYEKLDGNIVEPRTITADKIVVGSITTNEITTQNLQGTNGWINLSNGTFFYGNGASFANSTNAIDWNGTKLQIKADEFLLSSGETIQDTIEIGGRNLVLNTSDEWNTFTIIDGTNKTIAIAPTNSFFISTIPDVQVDDIIQISFDIKFDSNWHATGTGTKSSYIVGTSNNTPWTTINMTGGNKKDRLEEIMASTSREGHVTTYFKVTSIMIDGSGDQRPRITIRFDYYAGDVSIKCVKIEKGTKETAWTPAPEDKVGNNQVISKINVSPETIKIQANKVEIDGTAVFNDSNFQASYSNAQNAYTVIWDKNQGSTAAGGEARFQKKDPITGIISDEDGWVMWNGVKRTVPVADYNPNTLVPFNIPVYLVLRLSSTASTTGSFYPVWRANSKWNYLTGGMSAATSGTEVAEWTWVEATDIVLASCVEPWSEGQFTDCRIYDPPWNCKQVTTYTITAGAVNEAAAPKTSAVMRTQRIYYQNNSTTAPATPGSSTANWVTDTTGDANKWTTKRMSYASATPYIWTCEQKETVSGAVSYTTVLLDDTTTVIDGGKIITGSVTANQLASNSVTADKIAANAITIGDMDSDAQSKTLNSNIEIGGGNLLRNTNNISEMVGVPGALWISGGWGKAGTGTITCNVPITDSPIPEFTSAVKVEATAANTNIGIVQIGVPFKGGRTITHSVWVKGTAGDAIRLQPLATNASSSSLDSGYQQFTIPDNKWNKYEWTKTVSYDHPIGYTNTAADNNVAAAGYVMLRTATVGNSILIVGNKLEYGNKSTDWSPAPNDVINENLLMESQKMSGWALGTKATIDISDDFGVISLTQASTSDGNSLTRSLPTLPVSILDGTPLCLSFEYKSSGALSDVRLFIVGSSTAAYSSTVSQSKYARINHVTSLPSVSVWRKVAVQCPSTVEELTSGSGNVNSFYIQIAHRTASQIMYVRNVKLERGIGASEWTSGIEDYRSVTTIDNNGIWVTPPNKRPTNTSSGAGATGTKIDSNGVGIYKSGSNVAQYGATTRIGQEASGQGNILVDSDSISFRKYKTALGTFKNISGDYATQGLTIIAKDQFNVFLDDRDPAINYPAIQVLKTNGFSGTTEDVLFNDSYNPIPTIAATHEEAYNINLTSNTVTFVPLDQDILYSDHFDLDNSCKVQVIHNTDTLSWHYRVRVSASAYVVPSSNAFVDLFVCLQKVGESASEVAAGASYISSSGGVAQLTPRVLYRDVSNGDKLYLQARIRGSNGTLYCGHRDTQFIVELL